MNFFKVPQAALTASLGLTLLFTPGCPDETTTGTTPDVAAAEVSLDGASDGASDGLGDTPGGDADSGPVDVELPPVEPGLQARLYLHDPVTENNTPIQVTLHAPTTADGSLISQWVETRNCLNEEGGEAMSFGGFAVGNLCHEVQTAFPDVDGNYLHYGPDDDSDPNDAWPQVMMYHHVNIMHDYFKDTHGLTDLDLPIQAIVNLQFWIDPAVAPLIGGTGGWTPFPNAAYIPGEQFAAFNLPPRDDGAIVFGQDTEVDFSWDSSVIYHEYTHAMIGGTRLIGYVAGDHAVEDLLSLNEGFADFFSATFSGKPEIGSYGIATLAPNQLRDLRLKRTCPESLIGEAHADGQIIGSALWAVRTAIGPELTDAIVLRASQSFTAQTTLQLVGEAIMAEAATEAAGVATDIEAILTEYGVLGCVPVREWKPFSAFFTGLPLFVPSAQSTQNPAFSDWAPGVFQMYVDVPSDKVGVTLTWTGQAQSQFGGAAAADLDLAVKVGDTPVTISYSPGASHDGTDVDVPAAAAGTTKQEVTLSAACITAGGRSHVMLMNRGGAAQLDSLAVKYVSDLAGAPNVVTCQ